MLYFYPGPAKLYPQIREYLTDAYDCGILSMNHRSIDFVNLSKSVIYLLKDKLNIPQDYAIFFVSSATESWEIIAQSLTEQGSLHIFNGAFGQKWAEYAHKIHQKATHSHFEWDTEIRNDMPTLITKDNFDVVCLTQNETSNGTQVSNENIKAISEKYKKKLVAIDATSSMAGIELAWENADIWFASVQKCFGLPAGLGLCIYAPKAIEKALQINDKKYYNSFIFLHENIQKFQTNYTPNVLNIYLLQRVLEKMENIKIINERTKQNAQSWYRFLQNNGFDILIKNESVRSDTVITVHGTEGFVKLIKEKANQANIILGNGYGAWKNTTFRIANFPAITDEEIEIAKQFFIRTSA
jgi:phosphoserine aminotransferase